MTEAESVASAARRLLRMLDERTLRRPTNVTKLPIAATPEQLPLDLSSPREIKSGAR